MQQAVFHAVNVGEVGDLVVVEVHIIEVGKKFTSWWEDALQLTVHHTEIVQAFQIFKSFRQNGQFSVSYFQIEKGVA